MHTSGHNRVKIHFTLQVLLAAILVSSVTLWASDRSVPTFSSTFETYSRLTRDPGATRDQWLKVIRSFRAIARRATRVTKSRSLFLAGKASLILYSRSGRIEDLDNAIAYFHEVKRITRFQSRLTKVLEELRSAHLLRKAYRRSVMRRAGNTPADTVARVSGKGYKAKQHSPVITQTKTGAREQATRWHQVAATSHAAGTNRLSSVPQGNPFYPARPGVAPKPVRRMRTAALPRSTPLPAQPQVSENTSKKRTFTVVIDPGHGGKDPGAVSTDGKLEEKNVTLQVSRRLKKRLEERVPGIKVVLTRDDDSFMTLSQRTAMANALNADLFISIHCNSYADSSAYGLETYYLSKAGSKRAMRVAARENGIPVSRMNDVEATLLDLLMTSKKCESQKLAKAVHRSLARATSGRTNSSRDRGVKRGPLYVLLGATMPAILVECGYISNSRDRTKLSGRPYLDTIARGIATGAHKYLNGLGKEG